MKLNQCCCVVLVLLVSITFSGCATKRNMYNWGSYQDQVNAHFKSTGSPEQQIAALEKSMATSPKNHSAAPIAPVPPGYHAHLGMLYGEVGRIDDMQVEFETEKMLFPESAAFMDFMLNNMNKKNKKGAL